MVGWYMLTQIRAIIRRIAQHRSTYFTSEGLVFLFFTLAVGVAAINTGNNLFYLLLAMMLSIILISGIVADSCLRRLEFHRHLPDLLFANETATATLVAKNGKSKLPGYSLRLCDVSDGKDLDRGLVIDQLLPGASRLLSYPLVSLRRGRLRLDGVRAATSFPFGLFLKKAYYPVNAEVVVCPAIKPLSDGVLQDVLAVGQEHAVHRKGYGNELHNLRLYHAGDDSRAIHWVTTARTAKLTVRETEAEDQRRAAIYVSLIAPDSHDAVFEEAVAFTASLLYHLATLGYQFKLTAGEFRSSFGQGDPHLLELLRALALCERRSPVASPPPGDDGLADMGGGDNGTVIVVRPWRGAAVSVAHAPLVLIDAETLVGASNEI